MPLTVVVGAQYGGEGKGKVVSHLSIADDVDIVVRCGGPNSGHTVDYGGFRAGLRMLPAGVVHERTKLMIAPGAPRNATILRCAMKMCGAAAASLLIDRNTRSVADG